MAISDAIRAEVETISDDPDSEISLTLDELAAGVNKAYENTYKGGSTEGSTKTSRSRLTDTRRTRPKRATKSLTCR